MDTDPNLPLDEVISEVDPSDSEQVIAAFKVYMRGARFPPTGPDHRIWLAFQAGWRAARQ